VVRAASKGISKKQSDAEEGREVRITLSQFTDRLPLGLVPIILSADVDLFR
jgi:hypothetical protein